MDIHTPSYEKHGGMNENIVTVEIGQAFDLKFAPKRNTNVHNSFSESQHTNRNR